MAVITIIGGVPLYDNLQEALAYAAANNLSGYHIHYFQGIKGFMGGANHQQATGMPLNTNAPSTVNPNPPRPIIRTTTPRSVITRRAVPRSTTTGGGGSSGSGGY